MGWDDLTSRYLTCLPVLVPYGVELTGEGHLTTALEWEHRDSVVDGEENQKQNDR